jgi:8-amino-3,8-dideoxy-alpha-D-manno-octulosonate transaminase
MTEMQAAVGLAQIKKLEYILKKKKYNKNIFINQIKKNIPNLGGLGIKIRYSHINAGDQNDHLIFFLRNGKIAKNVKKQLDSINIKTGILPLAARWHYAGYWNHIWRESTKFRFYNRLDFWKNAWYLVTRSISFPISILENKKQIVKKANLISKVFSDFN